MPDQEKEDSNSCELSNDSCLVYLIPNRLAFATGSSDDIKKMKQRMPILKARFMSSDLHRKYVPFAADFGPVNLGVVHRFCDAFAKRLFKQEGQLVYCFECSLECRANASFLLAAFMVLYYRWSPQQAAAPFKYPRVPFTLKPFHDATHLHSDDLLLEDCLRGLERAGMNGWYSRSTFDLALYEELDDPLHGDIHQICPKFVAFKGPIVQTGVNQHKGEVSFPPSAYIHALRRLRVTCVIRLNEADTYDRSALFPPLRRPQHISFHRTTTATPHLHGGGAGERGGAR